MSKVIVGKWGKCLAIRVPLDVARAAGLKDGESVDIETIDGDIRIRRDRAQAFEEGRKAMAEIAAGAKGRRLDGLSIRELIDTGRR